MSYSIVTIVLLLHLFRRSRFAHRRSTSSSSAHNPAYGFLRDADSGGGGDHSWGSGSSSTGGGGDTSLPPYLPSAAPRKLSQHNTYAKTAAANSAAEVERPQTLELPMTPRTPARSSLRKTSSYGQHHHGSSTGGTPTRPSATPPDPLPPPGGGLDSGFASATTNRVRFSPSPFDLSSGNKSVAYVTDWSPVHEQQQHKQQQQQQSSRWTPLHRTSSGGSGQYQQPHHITESDLKRDFDFYRK